MSQTKAQLISDLVQALNFTGTSSAPANGMYLSAANTISLSTNSTAGRLTISSTGEATFAGSLTVDTNTFHVNASDNRVGIGTASPASILHVESSAPSIRFVDTDASGGFGMVGVNNTSGSLVLRSDDGNSLANSYMGFEIDGGTKMYIDSSGRLMVGQTSPYAATGTGNMMLTIAKSATNRTDIAISNQSNGDDASAAVVLATHGQDYILEATGSGNTTDGASAFRILKSSTERLRINSAGHLGLNVIPGSWDTTFIALEGGGTSKHGALHFQANGDWTTSLGCNNYYNSGWKYRHAGGASWFEMKEDTFKFSIAVSGDADGTITWSEKLRITSGGQVCVGTTSGPGEIGLYLGDGTNPAGHIYANGTHHLYLLANAYYAGGWKYLGNGEANSLALQNGDFLFNNAPTNSNGAAAAITWSERFRITSDGDVGIGNTSPSCKLAITDLAEHTTYASATPSVTACMLQIFNNPPNEAAGHHATIQLAINGGSQNRVNTISAVSETSNSRHTATTFCTDDGSGRTEKLRITSTGKIHSLNAVQSGGNTTSGFQFDAVNSSCVLGVQGKSAANGGAAGNALFQGWFGSSNTFRVNCDGRIKTSKGIDFDAVDNDTTNASSTGALLSDYEEGTFSPTLKSNGAANTYPTQSYTVNAGYYTRVGRICHVTFDIQMAGSGITSGSNYCVLASLPFKIYNANNARGVTYNTCRWSSWTQDNTPTTAYGHANDYFVYLLALDESKNSEEYVGAGQVTNSTRLMGSLTYTCQ